MQIVVKTGGDFTIKFLFAVSLLSLVLGHISHALSSQRQVIVGA